jgi:hypothetical protein
VQILVDEGADNVGLEAVLLIDDVVGDSKLFGYGACVVDVVERAAASLNCFGHSVLAGEATLVPELEGKTDEIVPFRAQNSRDRGGVDSSGHGDCDRVVGLVGHNSPVLFSQSSEEAPLPPRGFSFAHLFSAAYAISTGQNIDSRWLRYQNPDSKRNSPGVCRGYFDAEYSIAT